jgi:hypothetical protein
MQSFGRFLSVNRYAGLLISLILLALIGPEAEQLIPAKVTSAAIFTMILISSAFVVAPNRRDLITALTSAGFSAVLWIIYNVGGQHSLAMSFLTCAVTVIFVVVICGIILRDVFDGDVTANKLCGALCAYLLIGTAFALIYMTATIVDPHAFEFIANDGSTIVDSSKMGHSERLSILIYHSFLTLSTCGYGDIVPLSQPVRSVCWIEAIVGQAYLAVIVARLVGLHIVAAKDTQKK